MTSFPQDDAEIIKYQLNALKHIHNLVNKIEVGLKYRNRLDITDMEILGLVKDQIIKIRDFNILAARQDGLLVVEIAEIHQLTPPRVSQIIGSYLPSMKRTAKRKAKYGG